MLYSCKSQWLSRWSANLERSDAAPGSSEDSYRIPASPKENDEQQFLRMCKVRTISFVAVVVCVCWCVCVCVLVCVCVCRASREYAGTFVYEDRSLISGRRVVGVSCMYAVIVVWCSSSIPMLITRLSR